MVKLKYLVVIESENSARPTIHHRLFRLSFFPKYRLGFDGTTVDPTKIVY